MLARSKFEMNRRRRMPNPWIAIPSLLVGLIAGILGWTVTDVSCRPGSCSGWAVGMSIASFLVATAGMLVVMVLIFRSLQEHYGSRDNSTTTADRAARLNGDG